MQKGALRGRRSLMGIGVRDLDMVLTSEGRNYRLMIKDDDCTRLVLMGDDYEIVESGCLDRVDLTAVINFIMTALPH